jgi:hypothetical protein
MKFINLIFDHISQLLVESRNYRIEKRSCKNCDRLVHLLEIEKSEKAKLLNLLTDKLSPPTDAIEESSREESLKPIQVGQSWAHKRYKLEQEAREKAARLKEEFEFSHK